MRFQVLLCAVVGVLKATAQWNPHFSVVKSEDLPQPLPVELKMIGNTKVEVSIVNTRDRDLKVSKHNSFLDQAPVLKIHLSRITRAEDNEDDVTWREVPFTGIKKALMVQGFSDKDFVMLPKGKAVKREIDLAETWDVSTGGEYEIWVGGILPIAEKGNKISKWIAYQSDLENKLLIKIDGQEAEETQHRILQARSKSRENDKCNPQQLSDVEAAHRECTNLAFEAAKAALSGPEDRMIEYFDRADPITRLHVSTVLSQIGLECASVEDAITTYGCPEPDPENSICEEGVYAEINVFEGAISYCPEYFNNPVLEKKCNNIDIGNGKYEYHGSRAGITVHEMSHSVYIGRTEDYGYAYNEITALARLEKLYNADTYEFFATAVRNNCKVKKHQGFRLLRDPRFY